MATNAKISPNTGLVEFCIKNKGNRAIFTTRIGGTSLHGTIIGLCDNWLLVKWVENQEHQPASKFDTLSQLLNALEPYRQVNNLVSDHIKVEGKYGCWYGNYFDKLVTIENSVAEKQDLSKYPHKCISCGAPAYYGFSTRECSKGCK